MRLSVIAIMALAVVVVAARAGTDDLPPPPGALEREFEAPQFPKPAEVTPGPRLAAPIDIPFILEGGHIIVEAAVDGTAARPFMFDTGATPTLPAVLRSTGLIVDKPDHDAFEVLDTLPGSAAERAGLRRGDRIVAVAGQPARDLSTSDVARLSAPQDHTPVAVATADHRHFELAISQLLP